MDTWYYDNAFSPVGLMDLGESGTTVQLGVREWLAQQVYAFEAAFAGLVQLCTDLVDTHYWHPNPGRLGLPREAFWERRGAEVPLPPETVITGTIIHFDARATLRGPKGYIGDRWLRNVGALQLGTRQFGSVQQHPGVPPIAPKFAWLHLDIVSLFLPGNQALLAHTREEWKRLRAEDPTVTIDVREDAPALPVVTLVDPPHSTPSDNRELYERNGPRLTHAISAWEELKDQRSVCVQGCVGGPQPLMTIDLENGRLGHDRHRARNRSLITAGNMLCRAPTSATTCAGSSPTGAQLTYDTERRLTNWQNAPTHSTSHAWFLYDREGHRDAARYTLYVTPHPSDQPA